MGTSGGRRKGERRMSDEMPTSPSRIEVDDAAAYFGVTESSDVLHSMMAMPREEAMVCFALVILTLKQRVNECSARVEKFTTSSPGTSA